jgi:peptide deformylase
LIRSILKYNHTALRQVALPFDWSNPEHTEALLSLRETFLDCGNARGLAATQLGLMVRAFIVNLEKRGVTMFVNPQIVKVSHILETEREECLSFPNLKVNIQRPVTGYVKWQEDATGEFVLCQLRGWDFRCFLHELDHLDGVTIDSRRRRE